MINVITDEDKRVMYEMVNRLYYLKKRLPKMYIKMIKDELERRDKEDKKVKNFLKQKFKENFDKKTRKQFLKLI